ncbi:hypothetical protein [Aeromonas caviae]
MYAAAILVVLIRIAALAQVAAVNPLTPNKSFQRTAKKLRFLAAAEFAR